MKEKVWIHIPKNNSKHLGPWKGFYAYETESKDLGKLVAYSLYTHPKEYKTLILFLEESNIIYEVFRREYSFSKKELNDAEIFQLIVDNAAEKFNSPLLYVKPNERGIECPECQNIIPVAKSKIEVGYHSIKKYDVSQTYSPINEIIVSERLQQISQINNLTGLNFTPIYQLGTDDVIKNFYQLTITEGIGNVVPPSIVDKGSKCNQCGFYDKFLCKTLLYFSRTGYKGLDICLTHNWFGQPPIFAGQEIIISSSFYKVLMKSRIKGFTVRPAFFVD